MGFITKKRNFTRNDKRYEIIRFSREHTVYHNLHLYCTQLIGKYGISFRVAFFKGKQRFELSGEFPGLWLVARCSLSLFGFHCCFSFKFWNVPVEEQHFKGRKHKLHYHFFPIIWNRHPFVSHRSSVNSTSHQLEGGSQENLRKSQLKMASKAVFFTALFGKYALQFHSLRLLRRHQIHFHLLYRFHNVSFVTKGCWRVRLVWS